MKEFGMVILVIALLVGIGFLIYVGEQQRREALAKFDYEKMVGVGKDFEFAVSDKANVCSNCRTRNYLALLIQKVVREEREYENKKLTYKTKYYTFYTFYCGHCGKKTMKENHNLADAMYEWESR